jgi:hypothetical protein
VPPTAAIVGKLFGVRYLTTLFGLNGERREVTAEELTPKTAPLARQVSACARSVIERHGYHANTIAFQRTQTTLEIG